MEGTGGTSCLGVCECGRDRRDQGERVDGSDLGDELVVWIHHAGGEPVDGRVHLQRCRQGDGPDEPHACGAAHGLGESAAGESAVGAVRWAVEASVDLQGAGCCFHTDR